MTYEEAVVMILLSIFSTLFLASSIDLDLHNNVLMTHTPHNRYYLLFSEYIQKILELIIRHVCRVELLFLLCLCF